MDRHRFQGSDAYLDLPTSLSATERAKCLAFIQSAVRAKSAHKVTLLSAIPITQSPSIAGLSILNTLLTLIPGPWPVFHVQCCYARLWKHLPEAIKAGEPSAEQEFVSTITHNVQTTYSDLLSLFPTDSSPAIRDSQTGTALIHNNLHRFIQHFRLPGRVTGSSKLKVAIALPNGPILGLALLAVTTYYISCPISVSAGAEQFKSDILQAGPSVIMVTQADVDRLGLKETWVFENGIQIVVVALETDMTLSIDCQGHSMDQVAPPIPNRAEDVALMLFTSGTSGTKKTVPITTHSLVSGIAFVIESWGLQSHDVCLNMMPLFHVGGIVRNLFAPIMAGGSTICCAAFDANSFWDIIEDHSPTWYYASPTMHQMILDAAQFRPESLEKSRMRLICNAAGGLLPSLACNLRDAFKCIVLPSYGMTECMPISSPPLDYKLDRPGTSGVSVGPDLGILDDNDKLAEAGKVGKIVVRGAPLFHGYLKGDGSIDRSPFNKSNWFDTGDMGYMDQDGFLYVTGRNKEVINRGGELISPFEIEEAVLSASQIVGSPIEGRIGAVLAFSMPHDVLQETVGLAVVTPSGQRRVCIKTVQQAVKDSLSQVKWPQVIVFMDDLPRNNNKLLRIKLAERMDMSDLSDSVLLADRHYEAKCPPANSPLTVKISTRAIQADLDAVAQEIFKSSGLTLDVYIRPSSVDGYPEAFLAPAPDSTCPNNLSDDYDPVAEVRSQLDDLNVPVAFHILEVELPLDEDGDVDLRELDNLTKGRDRVHSLVGELSVVEKKVATMFARILACPMDAVRKNSDFFEMGGDSLRAGRLLSELRKESKTRIPVDILFTSGRVEELAKLFVNVTESETVDSRSQKRRSMMEFSTTKACSSTNVFLMLIQLFPVVVVYPMKRALTWTFFMYLLSISLHWPTTKSIAGRLLNLIFALGAARLITMAIAPVVGIIAKWIIMGSYREGLYPMWGFYHTRWWMTQKILSICGRGHFGATNTGLILYYRLLGAKIGKNVTIDKMATLGEYDLLEIRDGANLDKCICRAFAVERNTTMYLGRVRIGAAASVGRSSIVAPGTVVPDNACIGPNSSSWEIKDSDESNRLLSASKIPVANFFLELIAVYPLLALVNVIRAGPWAAGLIGIVKIEPGQGNDSDQAIISWFAQPYRIGFHYLALILHSFFGPMFWFLAVFVIKKIIDAAIGKIKPGRADTRSQGMKLLMGLWKRLLSVSRFHTLIDLFGAHYEPTSILYRMLGAKVGKRVYWPGTGPMIQNFDLLDIGDNVVFGSRSTLLTSDGYGSEYVKVENNAMISDRVLVLPGTIVGEKTVLGSGALTRRDKYYPAETVWVGSRGGEAVCLTDPRKSPGLKQGPFKPVFDNKMQTKVVTSELTPSRMSYDVDPKSRFSISLYTNDMSDVKSKNQSTSGLGTPVSVQPSSPSSSPFGRAFYEGLANYRVWGLTTIIFYSSMITIFTTFYWNVSTTTAVQIVARLLPLFRHYISAGNTYRPLLVYLLFTICISILQTALAVLALCIVISAKWIVIGRRSPGNYNWDTSTYCQRWQLYLAIERLRRQCYGGLGILGLLTGTHYMVWYYRLLGAKIGKNCALFASGSPSCLLTEPDLVTLGDRVAVDDASLVGHINSRGVFNLNELHVGSGSVLRSGSRLLSGAKMGREAVLMEHCLVMAGDVVEDESVRQGWPSEEFEEKRMPTLLPNGQVLRDHIGVLKQRKPTRKLSKSSSLYKVEKV